MNISSLLLSLRFARLPALSFSLALVPVAVGMGLLWSQPVRASQSSLLSSPSVPPPQLAAAASPSRPALLSPAPPPRPLPAQDCVPGIVSCSLKIPPFLCWMCSVCVSFPLVCEDAWGCASMNLGGVMIFCRKPFLSVCVFVFWFFLFFPFYFLLCLIVPFIYNGRGLGLEDPEP